MTITGWRAGRVYRNHHLDSARWQAIAPRPGDIVVTTSYKSGTTWTQGILHQLIFRGAPDAPPLMAVSPWIDARFFAPVEEVAAAVAAQPHRRFLKSHLPADGLPYHPTTRYLVVARDPRDVFMSLVNHYASYTDEAMARFNDDPSLPPFPRFDGDVRGLWRTWMTRGYFDGESEGYPWWGNLQHTASYWPHRDLENVLLVHYNDLAADLPGEIERIAAFLDIPLADGESSAIADAVHIDRMRDRALREDEMLGQVFQGGPRSFFYEGRNGRWRDVLADEDLALYEAARDRVLPPDCAAWLERGWRG